MNINSGFNEFVFKLIELRAMRMDSKEKDCIICLDEMTLKSHLVYNITKDKIIGFQQGNNSRGEIAGTALVVMVRGVAYNWKQPIAHFFISLRLRLIMLKTFY